MFCPSCGKTNSTEQKFCRSCGLSLEATLASLVRQTGVARSDALSRRKERIELALVWLGGGALAAFISVMIYTVVTKIIIDKGDLWSGVGFIAFFLVAAAAILLVIYKEALADKIEENSNVRSPDPLKPADTNQLTEASFDRIPSVTESTTELLNAERKR